MRGQNVLRMQFVRCLIWNRRFSCRFPSSSVILSHIHTTDPISTTSHFIFLQHDATAKHSTYYSCVCLSITRWSGLGLCRFHCPHQSVTIVFCYQMHDKIMMASPSNRALNLSDLCIPATAISGRRHLRSAVTGTLLVPRARTATGKQSFTVNRPTTWNRLPPALQSPDLLESAFKRALKTHLFSAVRRHWDIFMILAPDINIQTYLLT